MISIFSIIAVLQYFGNFLLYSMVDTCTHVLISSLFTVAKTWKQPKYPLTDDWIRKMWYMLTVEYHSAIKRNKIMPFPATWMELGILILSGVSHRYL